MQQRPSRRTIFDRHAGDCRHTFDSRPMGACSRDRFPRPARSPCGMRVRGKRWRSFPMPTQGFSPERRAPRHHVIAGKALALWDVSQETPTPRTTISSPVPRAAPCWRPCFHQMGGGWLSGTGRTVCRGRCLGRGQPDVGLPDSKCDRSRSRRVRTRSRLKDASLAVGYDDGPVHLWNARDLGSGPRAEGSRAEGGR